MNDYLTFYVTKTIGVVLRDASFYQQVFDWEAM